MGGWRIAGGIVLAVMLSACASNDGPTPPAPQPQNDMSGRWMLAAPNAPPCGMEFQGVPGQLQGTINPEGGCPGNFFTSRKWTFEHGMLIIRDHKGEPLAQFAVGGDRLDGQATSGTPMSLSR